MTPSSYPIGNASEEYLRRVREENDRKLRQLLIDLIRRGLVEIDYKESTVAKDGMVALKVDDPHIYGVRLPFDRYKELKDIAEGRAIDKDWSGYVRSNTGGYWKKPQGKGKKNG